MKQEDVNKVIQGLLDGGVNQGEILRALHLADDTQDANIFTIERARELYCYGSDDDIEIDDEPLLSASENGVWVSAWVYVRTAEEGDGE